MSRDPSALVVGAGPNGLAAAITLARAGWRVTVREAAPVVGGGARSAELTLPGYVHDVCSAIHPLAVASPLFRELPLAAHGLSWVEPPAALAHPFDDGTAALLERSLAATAVSLGGDAGAYRALMAPLVEAADVLFATLLGPPRLPRPSLALPRFGLSYRVGRLRFTRRCPLDGSTRRAPGPARCCRFGGGLTKRSSR